MASKETQKLKLLREKAQWLLTKPILGGYQRLDLERMIKRINLTLEPESAETVIAEATALINKTAQAEPMREARV